MLGGHPCTTALDVRCPRAADGGVRVIERSELLVRVSPYIVIALV